MRRVGIVWPIVSTPSKNSPFDTRVLRIEELLGSTDASPKDNGLPRVRMITTPDAVEAVLHSRSIQRIDLMRQIAGNGLLFSDGDTWKERRRIMQPAFPGRDPLHDLDGVGWALEGLLERLQDAAAHAKPVGLLSEMLRFTTRAIYRVAFGIELAPDHDVADILLRFFDAAGETVITVIDRQGMVDPESLRKLHAARQQIDEEVDRIIALRRDGRSKGDDVLGELIQAAAHGDPDEEGLRDELRTLLLAGAETTSNVLTWLFLLLDAHPDARSAIERSIDENPTAHSPSELTAAIHETMRLYPPVWYIARRAVEPTEICGENVRDGDWMIISTYMVQRDKETWDDPHAFRPARFDADTPLPHRYAWFPFGGGRHLCLGRNLGELEATVAARAIMDRYQIRRVQDLPPIPRVGLVLKPEQDIPVTVTFRNRQAATP